LLEILPPGTECAPDEHQDQADVDPAVVDFACEDQALGRFLKFADVDLSTYVCFCFFRKFKLYYTPIISYKNTPLRKFVIT
jgi:hypothetical protein